MKSYLAIDPGVSGGLAYDLAGDTIASKMPGTERDLVDEIRSAWADYQINCVAVIEDIPKFTGNKIPGSSVFTLAFNYGLCRGILTALEIPTILVKPHDWQKHFRLGTKKDAGSTGAWKNKLKAEAQRRCPHLKVTLDTADALLILAYAREKNL